jgi:hypothetical protein
MRRRLVGWLAWPSPKVVAGVLLAGLIWLMAGGCAPGTALVSRSSSAPTPARIALLPMADMARVYGVGHSVRSPLTGKVFVTGETSPELAGLMTDEIEGHLRSMGYLLASPEAVGNAMAALSAGEKGALGERGLIMAAARRVEADAALVGYLYRSQERQGARFAVREPASVAYGLYLIDAQSGRTLWSGEFDETQRSLDEDLLNLGAFIQRRGEWIRADQMATASLREMLADFPTPPGDAVESGDAGSGTQP